MAHEAHGGRRRGARPLPGGSTTAILASPRPATCVRRARAADRGAHRRVLDAARAARPPADGESNFLALHAAARRRDPVCPRPRVR